LVDCARNYDNFGCNGGLPSHAFQYIFDAGGIETERVYPYVGADRICHFEASEASVGVTGGSVNIT